MAGQLKCPSCIESQKPLLHPPASTKDEPSLFEVVGTDLFEYEHGSFKHKLIIWRDRASRYVYTRHLKTYTGSWGPSSSEVISSFYNWLDGEPKSNVDFNGCGSTVHLRHLPELLPELRDRIVDSSC